MDCKRCSETIIKLVMPQSFPIGIKILKDHHPLPQGVVRPGKFGIKIAMCQWINLARRWGWVVAAMAEDINCTPCLAGFGFKRLKNRSDFAQFAVDMGYFDSLEAAIPMVEQLEFIEPGEVRGIMAFPLAKAPVEPDIVAVYGTPAQMTRLAYAHVHSHSQVIHSTTSFGLSCVSILMPFWKGEPTLVHPGRGERTLAGVDDSEMIFTTPASKLEAIVDGLEKTHKKGLRYPIQGYALYEPPLIPPMKTLEEKLVDP